MKRGVLRVGLAALCSVAILSEAALAAVVSGDDLPQMAIAQRPNVEEAIRLLEEGKQFFRQGTAEGYRQAIIRLEQVLQVAEQTEDTKGIAWVSLQLGLSHYYLSEREMAVTYYQKALSAFQEIQDREFEATTLNNIAVVYNEQGKHSEALDYHKQALEIQKEIGDREGIATTLNNIGGVYNDLGDRNQALNYYNQALAMMREVGDRAGAGRTLVNIGGIHHDLGKPSEALGYFNQALPILQTIGDRAGEATTFNKIGAIYHRRGERNQALESYKQALQIQQAIGDREGIANSLNNIGGVYYNLGNRSQALDFFKQALEIQQAIGDRQGIATSLNNIGGVYHAWGKRSQALDFFNQALSIRQAIGDRAGEATSLNNIGGVYDALGNLSQALDYYKQALEIQQAIGDRAGEATSLNNIGGVYHDRGHRREDLNKCSEAPQSQDLDLDCYNQALDYYKQALSIQQDIGEDSGKASALNNIGAIYDALGNDSQALSYYKQALSIQQTIGDRLKEAATLNNIAGIYGDLGDRREALDSYNEALKIWQEVGDRSGEASTLNNIAVNYAYLGNLPTALEKIEAAIQIVEQLRGEITSTDLRTSYFATVQDYYQLKIDLLMQLHQQHPERGYDIRAFNTSERTRARTLVELLVEANIDITENVDPQLRQRERELRQQLQAIDSQRVAQLQAVENKAEIPAIVEAADRETNAVLRELDNLAAQLRTTSPAYAALQYPEPLTLEAVQQQVLDPGTTLVQYSLGTDRSYVWVVTADSFQAYSLPGRAEIETAAREFYASVAKAGNLLTTERKAQALSDLILAPIVPRLKTPRLLVVPDGILHQIPFSALATPNGEGYQPLLVNYELVSAPSSTAIATNRELMGDRPPAPNRLAVLADPVFSPEDPRVTGQPTSSKTDPELEATLRDFNLQGIKPLPYTRDEAEQLLALVPGSQTSVLDFDANYPWVTSNQANRYQFVHFATHGFANASNPELSGLVLSLVDAQGQPQNGFLRLVDIFNLQLPAELVVLSACQTGLGEDVRGEGIVGLTRGLMYAGAERTVLSLWNVNDKKTAQLMVQFYRSIWEQGLTPVAALRQAQLQMWKKGDHPYYWAAFGLQGEWRD